ncbi:TetR/AcrR family transcriptional regulator [Nocardia sp. IFM 10818]
MRLHCNEEWGIPRRVDHEERRRKIAAALWRTVSTQGLEGVSLRTVATAAGVSMGLVQHYFATKDDMLLYAYGMLSERVEARLRADQSAESSIRSLFLHMLPLDDERREEAHVAVAFMARAAVSPTFAAATSSPQLKEHLTGLLRNADVPAAPEQAEILLAAVDGMTVRILAGHLTPEAAAEALDAHLTRLGLS